MSVHIPKSVHLAILHFSYTFHTLFVHFSYTFHTLFDNLSKVIDIFCQGNKIPRFLPLAPKRRARLNITSEWLVSVCVCETARKGIKPTTYYHSMKRTPRVYVVFIRRYANRARDAHLKCSYFIENFFQRLKIFRRLSLPKFNLKFPD